jgi:D-alanyl-D-alanine carboxypeptidase
VLLPSLLWADERVSAPFSVQAVRIQDTIAARLSAKAQWALVAEDVASGKRVVEAGSPDAALAPASLVKLFVAGAALDQHAKEPVDLATSILTDGQIVRGKLFCPHCIAAFHKALTKG